MKCPPVPALIALALLTGCSKDEVSTAEVASAAEERVREKFGLPADVKLQTTVFVGVLVTVKLPCAD